MRRYLFSQDKLAESQSLNRNIQQELTKVKQVSNFYISFLCVYHCAVLDAPQGGALGTRSCAHVLVGEIQVFCRVSLMPNMIFSTAL